MAHLQMQERKKEMRSCIKKNTYRILHDEERFATTLNKSKTDKTLKKLLTNFEELEKTLETLYNNEPEIYEFIQTEIYGIEAYLDVNEGRSYVLQETMRNIRETQEALATNKDKIPEDEDVTILEDIGFKKEIFSPASVEGYYTKTLCDTEEKEVIEEIIMMKDKTLHREREVLWEETKYGRASKSINYTDMPTDEKLKKIIDNTKRENKKGK